MKTDLHQHLWTQPLVEALTRRSAHPFVRDEHGLTVLFLAGERPYVIDLDSEDSERRAESARRDGLDRALVCLSSPLGIESLPRKDATELIDAYHDGALALGEPFGVWGALALDRLDPDDVDRALARGCVGISLPAGALGSIDMLSRLSPVLGRIQEHGVPLFVHPGPGTRLPTHEATLGDPLWWPALTRYVAEVHAAWFVFVTAARRQFPELRVVFAMLAGLAPLHTERLLARGGPAIEIEDPLIFYDTSSNGPQAISLMERLVGSEQLLYGSDRPVVDPDCHGIREALDWESLAGNADRLFMHGAPPTEPPQGPEQPIGRAPRTAGYSPRRRTERRPSVGVQLSEPGADPRPRRVAVLGRAAR
ncbi:MAG TPA: amidohydrolase family protein [Solirubrobacteraceae bacterium]